MKKELPEGRTVVATGNEAAAYAAMAVIVRKYYPNFQDILYHE